MDVCRDSATAIVIKMLLQNEPSKLIGYNLYILNLFNFKPFIHQAFQKKYMTMITCYNKESFQNHKMRFKGILNH
jgi:hypothetical protein